MADAGDHDGGDDTGETSDKLAKPHDVVLLHGTTEDGEGIRALRSRPKKLELAEIRPVKEGKPIMSGGEVVRLQQREENPLLYDVEVQHREPAPKTHTDHAGPPRIASQEYRNNWEAIFGKPRRKRKALPN